MKFRGQRKLTRMFSKRTARTANTRHKEYERNITRRLTRRLKERQDA